MLLKFQFLLYKLSLQNFSSSPSRSSQIFRVDHPYPRPPFVLNILFLVETSHMHISEALILLNCIQSPYVWSSFSSYSFNVHFS